MMPRAAEAPINREPVDERRVLAPNIAQDMGATLNQMGGETSSLERGPVNGPK